MINWDNIIKVFEKIVKPTALFTGVCFVGYGLYKLSDKALEKGYRLGMGGNYDLNTRVVSAQCSLNPSDDKPDKKIDTEAGLTRSLTTPPKDRTSTTLKDNSLGLT